MFQGEANLPNAFRSGLGLGPLEIRVLELLWEGDRAATVRNLQERCPRLAYTTMMTTLDRLYRKNFLRRSRDGRAFVYEARYTREALLSRVVSGQLSELLGEATQNGAVLSTLVRVVERTDAALLDQLDALTQEARRRLKRK